MNVLTQHYKTYQIFQDIHKIFKDNGHELRIVGGAVRDLLQGKEPDDLDFCTTATPEEMMNFKGVSTKVKKEDWYVKPTGLPHGTVTFVGLKVWVVDPVSHMGRFRKVELEITTLRRDVECDGRRATVEFTSDWKEDASRRDFTINAMSIDIEGGIYDYFNGRSDLECGVIKFVGNAEDRIKEDALRMLRFFRFLCRITTNDSHGDAIYKDYRAVCDNAQLIKQITVERVWNEYTKVVKNSPQHLDYWLFLLDDSGLSCELEFPVRVNADVKKLSTDIIKKYPAFAIATQIDTLDKGMQFYKKYKLSRLERKQIEFFIMYATTLAYGDFTFQLIDDLLEQGYEREWIIAVATYHGGKYHEHYAQTAKIPVLPVTAQDLLDNDSTLEEGRKLGMLHKKVKQSWVDSQYTKTKEELINELSR